MKYVVFEEEKSVDCVLRTLLQKKEVCWVAKFKMQPSCKQTFKYHHKLFTL